MIDVAAFVAQWGAAAIAVGAGVEGEAAVMTGGALAASGLVSPIAAWAAATVGSAVTDQAIFGAGRWARGSRYVANVKARPAFARALGWIERWPNWFIVIFRFLPGLRVAAPIAIGLSSVAALRFVLLNIVSAIVWGAVFTFIGWRFGRAVEPFVARFAGRLLRWPVMLGAAGVVALAVLLVVLYRRRQPRQA